MKVKRALAGPDAVIRHFARYTRKRIGLDLTARHCLRRKDVTYRYRPAGRGNRAKLKDLDARGSVTAF